MSDAVQSRSLLDYLADETLKPVRWILANRDHADDEFCLIWPFQCNDSGYAMFNASGKANIRVHRVMCEYKNGPAPADKPDASHTCGRGHKACVNPHHVVWKSRGDNLKDIAKHGRRGNKRFKLTPEQVDEIRALQHRAKTADVAEQFGVTVNTIREIWAGRIWKTTNAKYKQLSEADVRGVRSTPWQVKSANQFAAELGVSRGVIEKIRNRTTYNWVSDEAEDVAA